MDDNEVRCQRPITPAYFGIEVSHTPYLVCKFPSFCQELISTVVIPRYSIGLQSSIRTTTRGCRLVTNEDQSALIQGTY